MSLFPTLRNNKNKEMAKVEQKVKDITESARTINESIVSISQTNKMLDRALNSVENADFSAKKQRIQNLNIDDEYKKELKLSIDKTKETTVNTLKPLVDKALRLEGNMIAAEIKAKSMLVILETQRRVLSSGQAQMDIIKTIRNEGSDNQKEINKLINDVEEINGMAKSALLGYNSSQDAIDGMLNGSQENTFEKGDDFSKIVSDFENKVG